MRIQIDLCCDEEYKRPVVIDCRPWATAPRVIQQKEDSHENQG